MTIEKFLVQTFKQDINIINLGYIHNKYLAKVFKLYKYIDVIEYWYDDDENPDHETWVDIEGMGYGWLWLDYQLPRNKLRNKQLRKVLFKMGLAFHRKEDVYTFRYDGTTYYLWGLPDEIIQIRLSNKELFPF